MAPENVEAFHADHSHSPGLVDASIKRSRRGVRVVVLALAILGLTTVAQVVVFADSIELTSGVKAQLSSTR